MRIVRRYILDKIELAIGVPDVCKKITIFTKTGELISKVDKKKIDQLGKKAREMAASYSAPGCATDAFLGITEALEIKGREEVFKATLGLSGGCGQMVRGTCGAILGMAMAISLSFGIDKKINDEIRKDSETMVPFYKRRMPKWRYIMFNKILYVIDRVKDKYGGTTCADIQFERHGQTFDSRDPRIRELWHADIQKCREVEGDIAEWGVFSLLQSTKWDEGLKEWDLPKEILKRGDQYFKEEEGFDLPPRWEDNWDRHKY